MEIHRSGSNVVDTHWTTNPGVAKWIPHFFDLLSEVPSVYAHVVGGTLPEFTHSLMEKYGKLSLLPLILSAVEILNNKISFTLSYFVTEISLSNTGNYHIFMGCRIHSTCTYIIAFIIGYAGIKKKVKPKSVFACQGVPYSDICEKLYLHFKVVICGKYINLNKITKI